MSWTSNDPLYPAFQSARQSGDVASHVDRALGSAEARGAVSVPRSGRLIDRSLGTTLTVTLDEVARCVLKGIERNERNASVGARNIKKARNRSDADVSIQGVLGEYAFCVLFALACSIDDTTPRSAGNEVYFDAVLDAEGWTVDVKTTIP